VTVAGFVDSTVRDIDARMAELQGELVKLQAARTALLGGGGGRRSAGGRSTGTRSPARGGSRRRSARRGGNTRARQALELVRERPGITIPEIAEAMGIEPNYLYRVMPRLVGEGEVRRDGQGWHPAN
jgi:CRP-like cAMP-binding protein